MNPGQPAEPVKRSAGCFFFRDSGQIPDRYHIGHIPGSGSAALTGVGVCMPIMIVIIAFAQLIGAGGAPRVSALYGEGRIEDAERLLGVCSVWLFAIGIVLTLIGQPLARPALLQFGASAQTLPYALGYLRVYLCGTVCALLSVGLSAFITAQGFTGVSLKIVLVGALLNLVLDPLFIFYLGMGVVGAAASTVISQTVSAALALAFLFGKRSALRLRPANFRLAPGLIRPCLALGLAPFLMTLTECFVSIAFNRSLLRYGGDAAVGAMAVFSAVMQIAVLSLQGLSQGAQPITSYNYGAKNYERVSENIRLLLVTSLVYAGTLWLGILLFPRLVVGIFTDEPQLIAYATRYIRYYFAALIMMGAQFACQNSFVALGNAKTSIFLALLRKVILLIPLIYLMPHFFSEKISAVFLAEPVADLTAASTTLVLFFKTYSKEKY